MVVKTQSLAIRTYVTVSRILFFLAHVGVALVTSNFVAFCAALYTEKKKKEREKALGSLNNVSPTDSTGVCGLAI
jgi:hypothetical protein